MSNKNRTTLYIGVTNNIQQRVLDHKCGLGCKFTNKYGLHDLLYFEHFTTIEAAINYEKKLKNWKRSWKLNLIKESNPFLKDLSHEWFSEELLKEYRQQARPVSG